MSKRDEARRNYIVAALVEAGSMFESDARSYLAGHDAARRAEVLNEAADTLEARVADDDVDTRTTWAGMDAAYLRHLAASAPVPVQSADVETGEECAGYHYPGVPCDGTCVARPLSPQREAEIAAARYTDRSTAAADIDIDDLLAELDRVRARYENFKAGVKAAGREMRKRLTDTEAERDALQQRLHNAAAGPLLGLAEKAGEQS